MNIEKYVLFSILLLVVIPLSSAAEINATPPSPAPGQKVILSVPASHPGATFSWEASKGRFESPTNRAVVVFIAPASGESTITCLEKIEGGTRLRNRTLLIAQAPAVPAEHHNAVDAVEPSPYDIGRGGFAPSGWMGDGEKQSGFVTDILDDHPPSGSPARRWIYHPKSAGWGAVAYQFPPGNWGDSPGRDLSGKSYRELSVWAKGVPDKSGRYPVIQFKAGGGSDPSKKHQTSFEVEGDFVTLRPEWVRYTVSLAGKDLSSVISAFTFVVRAEDNPLGATFLLSKVEYR